MTLCSRAFALFVPPLIMLACLLALPAASQAAVQTATAKPASLKLINETRAVVTIKNNQAGKRLLRQVSGKKVTAQCLYLVSQNNTIDVGFAARLMRWKKNARTMILPFRARMPYRPYECELQAGSAKVKFAMQGASPSDKLSEDEKFSSLFVGMLAPGTILQEAGYKETDPMGPFDTQKILASVITNAASADTTDDCMDPAATATYIGLTSLMQEPAEPCVMGVYGHKTTFSVVWKGAKWSEPGEEPDFFDGKTFRSVMIF